MRQAVTGKHFFILKKYTRALVRGLSKSCGGEMVLSSRMVTGVGYVRRAIAEARYNDGFRKELARRKHGGPAGRAKTTN